MDSEYAKPLKVECNTRKGEAIYRVESEQAGLQTYSKFKSPLIKLLSHQG